MDTAASSERLRAAVAWAGRGLVDREAAVEAVALAAVAREHVLLIGPPGTAKSAAARRVTAVLGGRYFEALIGRFTEPAELFGPIDLRRLSDGVLETVTTGMLPEAEIAFLDEVFRGSSAILNTLLGLLHERVYRRGTELRTSPLRLVVGATNDLPDDPGLEAFADRFLLRVHVRPTEDSGLDALLAAGHTDWEPPTSPLATLADLDTLHEASRAVSLDAVRPTLADVFRALRRRGLPLSDRRMVRSQRLIGAAAALEGRATATARDLWPLAFLAADPAGQAIAREVLAGFPGASRVLPYAAEEATSGPAARAERLLRVGQELLGQAGTADWPTHAAALLREIDASLAPEQVPPPLAAVRTALQAGLGEA